MNKRRLHHLWTKLRFIRPWYFLALAAILGVICIFALRANNQHMITLRNAVYTADQNAGDTQTALKNLQSYVTSHMNTNLSTGSSSVYPPIQLKYTYERLLKAQNDAAANSNTQIYTEAQHACEAQNSTDISGRNRVPCIEAYVRSHTAATAAGVPDALYKFSFISPRWSPDLAGWTLVAATLSAIIFVITFIVDRLFRRYV